MYYNFKTLKMKKLKLNELKVQSFVTSMEENQVETAKGGAAPGGDTTTIIKSVVCPRPTDIWECSSKYLQICLVTYGVGNCGTQPLVCGA